MKNTPRFAGRFVVVSALGALLATTWTATASAADANGMAEKGHIFISADRLFSVFNYSSFSQTETQNNVTTTNSVSGTHFSLLGGPNLAGGIGLENIHTSPRPAIDVTIIPNLTLGIAVPLAFGLGSTAKTKVEQQNGNTTERSGDGPTSFLIGIVPRVGYIIPINDWLAVWPRGGLGFYSLSSTQQNTGNNGNNNGEVTTTNTLFSIDLDPQLAIVPTEHFFMSIGPMANIPITGTRSTTATNGATTVETSDDISLFHIGLSASLGGWINAF